MPKSAPDRNPTSAGLRPLDAEAVLAWYDQYARTLPWRISPADRKTGIRPDPYRVWLSEVMLQQTTVAAVQKYFLRFTSLWPTVTDLAAAPLDAVLKEWAGLGYYARARNLHACAIAVSQRPDGRFPAVSSELLQLPGIGNYTAASVAAICSDERIAVLDGNVDRVMARYLALEKPVRDEKDLIRQTVQAAVPPRAGDFAQALMDLGATVCTPRAALCMLCPLQPNCLGTKENPLAYPVKPAKPERPIRYGHAFVMLDPAGDVYLQTRPDKGLLAKMTETPVSPWVSEQLPPTYPQPADWRHRGQVVHIFTHFRLELDIWSASVDPHRLDGGWWASRNDLAGEALPTLFRKVLAAAGLD